MWKIESAQRKNTRCDSNKDVISVEHLSRHCTMVGVFDGHGDFDTVARRCAERLVALLRGVSQKKVVSSLSQAFLTLEKELQFETDGSTATIALLWESGFAYTATVGDSLWIAGVGEKVIFGPTHNAGANQNERESALKRGGNGFEWEYPYICSARRGLQLCRSFGDALMRPAIIATPERKRLRLNTDNSWLVIMSDGVVDTLDAWWRREAEQCAGLVFSGRGAEDILTHFSKSSDDASVIVCRR